ASMRRLMVLSVVVLPDPDPPTTATNSPRLTARLTLLTAGWVAGPKDFDTFFNSMWTGSSGRWGRASGSGGVRCIIHRLVSAAGVSNGDGRKRCRGSGEGVACGVRVRHHGLSSRRRREQR